MLAAAQNEYERQTARATPLADTDKARIAALASDFPALWSDPRTPQRERKRMVRFLIEDVSLRREDKQVTVGVRFKAGQTTSFTLTVGPSATEVRRTPPEIIAEVDRLLDHYTEAGVAAELNRRGVLSGTDQTFNPVMVNHIRRKHGLQSRYARLRRQGLVTLDEMAKAIDVHPQTVKERAARGQLASIAYNDKNQRLYMPPQPTATVPCARCGTPIPERGAQGQRQKYCGVSCRTGAYAARRQAAGWKRARNRR